MAGDSFKAPVGTRDVLPPETERWQALVATFAACARRAGYGLVVTPVFEDIGVFERVGEGTDIVRKEMYELEDKSGRRMALRPEGTASVARAYIQHRPTTPWKAWYLAPNFRYERPQAGRYRQHHQLGAELIGTVDPEGDVEMVALAWDFLRAVGLTRFDLCINSMGDQEGRAAYAELLTAYLRDHSGELAPEDREKIETHPLRVLDSKRRATREVTAEAPRLIDNLSPSAARRFDQVQDGLRSLGVPFVLEPRLVRGLDYYTHTTFEFQASALDAAQDAVGGGGRYDGLVAALGGPATPGIGFGLGVERLLLALDAEGAASQAPVNPLVWVIDVADGRSARELTHELRRAGVAADRAFDGRSMKAQMKAADRSGAQLALIIGEAERDAGQVAVRDLRDGTEQRTVRRDEIVKHVLEHLR